MATKKKYYVVWQGRICGVFEDWQSCKNQIFEFQDAKYKAFESKSEADNAFKLGYKQYYKEHPKDNKLNSFKFLSSEDAKPIMNSLSVDAAWNSVSKVMEYQGVHTGSKMLIFRQGPFEGASNNIGEFLAIVHGLSLLKKQNSTLPIYSDSITAIAWVRNKKTKSIILPTDKNIEVFEMVRRAEIWLLNNTFSNPIIKWNTKLWGEIPADFGRK